MCVEPTFLQRFGGCTRDIASDQQQQESRSVARWRDHSGELVVRVGVALAAAMIDRALRGDPAAAALGDDVVNAVRDQPEAEYQGHDDDDLVGMGVDPVSHPGEEL